MSKQGKDYRLQFFFDEDGDAAWETPEIGFKWAGTAGLIFLESFSPSAPGSFQEGNWFEWEVPFTF